MAAKKTNPYNVVLDPEEQEIENMLDFKKIERPKNVKKTIDKP